MKQQVGRRSERDASAASMAPSRRGVLEGLARGLGLAGLGGLASLASVPLTVACAAVAGVEVAKVPEIKRTRLNLYVEAKDVPALIAENGGAAKVLFLDIRTRAEAMYVGMPSGVDALAPYVEHQEIMSDWDDKGGRYKLDPVQDFVPEVGRRLAAKGLGKDDTVVLICRSGDRSARAATRLAEDGYKKVWSVVDGFEGDMSPDGRRSVNGWKNAGLPWSYKLEKAKMYFPR